MTLEDKLLEILAKLPGHVVLRSELASLGKPAQITRAIAKVVSAGKLVRVSTGIYAKTRINKFTGKPTPAQPLEVIAGEIFQKLGVRIAPGKLIQDYNSGATTQVPVQFVVRPLGKRMRRKIKVGDRTVQYEKTTRKKKD